MGNEAGTNGMFWANADGERALARFRTLVDMVDEGICQLDSEGRFVAVNETLVELTGYSREDLLGEHAAIVLPDEDVDRLQGEIADRLPDDNRSTAPLEFTALTADGDAIPCELKLQLLVEDGRFRGTIGVIRDITERKRMERRLREREEQFRQFAEHIEEVFWMTPPDKSEITYVNPAYEEIWGRSRESLYEDPNSFLDAIHPDDRERVRTALDRQSEGEYDETYRVVQPDGEIRWVHDRAFPVEDDDGNVSRIVGIAQDVTERTRLEQELRQERDLVAGIIETSPVGIAVVDADGELAFANERAEEIYGRSREELNDYAYDDPRWDLVNEDGEPFEEGRIPFDRVVAEKKSVYDQVLGIRRPSGKRVWLSVNGAPQWNEDGDLERAVFAVQDITEQRELEAELEEILGRVTDAFYALDEECRFTHVNERAEELLQTAEENLIGETLWDQFPEAAEIDDVWDAFHEAMETQAPQSFELYYEPLEFWVEATVYPSATGVSVYFRDVTERRERERQLRESERRYRTLVESFPDGAVALFDEELEYTAIGGQLLEDVGVRSEDRVGNSVYDIYPDHILEKIEPHFEAVLEGEANLFEVEFHDRYMHVHTLPIRNADDEIDAGMVVAQDVTKRHEYERQLEASNERLEQFAYAASHDLQEPLRMVSSYLQLIESRYGDDLDEDGREFLEFAVDGADRMREMIDGLLEYSRIETRGDPFEPVALDDVLEAAQRDLRMKIDESGAAITADELPRVEGDANQLRQVFQNLLDNAIEYSCEEPPRIHVDAERDGSAWIVSVHDEGIGIDPDEQEQIFEVFQRLHSRKDHAGTGIGLALCERIVERHDGEIRVVSEPGEGSTFSVMLPPADESET